MDYMDYNDISSNIYEGVYSPKAKFPKTIKYQDDYIIDENKSVKWNREEVEKLNKDRTVKLKEYRLAQSKSENRFIKDLELYIINNGFNEKQANLIAQRAWDEGHSGGLHEVLVEAEDLIEFAVEIVDLI